MHNRARHGGPQHTTAPTVERRGSRKAHHPGLGCAAAPDMVRRSMARCAQLEALLRRLLRIDRHASRRAACVPSSVAAPDEVRCDRAPEPGVTRCAEPRRTRAHQCGAPAHNRTHHRGTPAHNRAHRGTPAHNRAHLRGTPAHNRAHLRGTPERHRAHRDGPQRPRAPTTAAPGANARPPRSAGVRARRITPGSGALPRRTWSGAPWRDARNWRRSSDACSASIAMHRDVRRVSHLLWQRRTKSGATAHPSPG